MHELGLPELAWHGMAGMEFKLGEQAGRFCLPAEDLTDQTLGGGLFTVAAFFGEAAAEKFTR
jgi:hypothetical protein